MLDALLGGLRWWRRLRGGHWERWHVGDQGTIMWLPLSVCSRKKGMRPGPDCYGTPTCEDWT